MDKTTPDPRAAIACVCQNLRKTARAVTQVYEAALEPSGLTVTQFSILVMLAVAERVPLGRAAAALVMDRTTLTRNLRPLEKRGWIAAERGPDRRERYLSVTARGRAALERALPLWQAVQERVVGRIGARKWDALRGDLGDIVAGVAGSEAANAN